MAALKGYRGPINSKTVSSEELKAIVAIDSSEAVGKAGALLEREDDPGCA
jgi:hypothetical protein